MNKIYNSIKDVSAGDPAQGAAEIDESKSGESWVQGLSEGEYCGICVEDRLCALVAIIGVANEGNIVRAVLEVKSFSKILIYQISLYSVVSNGSNKIQHFCYCYSA